MRKITEKKAISPIIATLLLILIAIAAGVIVYAYVIGFVGGSTVQGGQTNTLSIDQLVLTSAATKAPVTVFVRNLGPATETFDVGFYVKGGTSLNTQLTPAVVVSGGGVTDSLTRVTLAYASASSLTVIVTGCASTDAMTVKGFGASANSACSSGSATITLSLANSGFTVSSTFAADSGAFAAVNVGTGGAADAVGTSVTAGTISVAINTVAQLTLGQKGSQGASNPLSSGQSYTFQATGTDSATASMSAKSA